ncbi:MAG: hypothetical protein KDD48_01145 [Bdellovibrionales bacterium]|nr:hypothetical protein [Bdellovibrionales bacterium]
MPRSSHSNSGPGVRPWITGVSRDMIRNVLRQLRDEKKIKSVGKGRGAKWLIRG